MEKVLTIVVPTYNMEKYLDKCLTSLIVPEPEFMEQLEVLVVNDGSKDRSSEIAHSYQDRYPQTFRVIDKENGNYGSCVNRGLNEATGKYIKILDADDSFDTNVFMLFLTEMQLTDVDMWITDTISVDEDDSEIDSFFHKDILSNGAIVSFQELLEKGYSEKRVMMHNIAYRTSMLRQIEYRQTEGIFYTDTEWVHRPMASVEKIKYVEGFLYRYLVGRSGQSMSEEIRKKRLNDTLVVFRNMLASYNDYIGDKIHGDFLYSFMKLSILSVYEWNIYAHFYDNEKMKSFDAEIKGKYPRIYEDMNAWVVDQHVGFPFIKYWRTGNLFFVQQMLVSPRRAIRFYQHAMGRGVIEKSPIIKLWHSFKSIFRSKAS